MKRYEICITRELVSLICYQTAKVTNNTKSIMKFPVQVKELVPLQNLYVETLLYSS